MSLPDLHEQIGLFIQGYRQAGGDPSAMQAAVAQAFPRSTPSDFALGLIDANRASRGLPSLREAGLRG